MRKVEKRAVEMDIIASVTCDCCGEEIVEVKGSAFDAEIYIREGQQSSEGGEGTTYLFDFCHKCIREKVLPSLLSFAPTVKPERWEW